VVAPSPGVAPSTGGGGLPTTGEDLALLALIGGAALVTGAGVVVAQRRRTDASVGQLPADEAATD
jgi:LPXTG-motif cell wall-anchored protein